VNLGLLLCDHVAAPFLSVSGDYPEMFGAWLSGSPFNLRVYDVCAGQFPQSLDECDAYITSGSGCSAYDDIEWILRLKRFLVEARGEGKPFIGICFGHQIMAEALGGKVEKSEYGWGVGVRPMEIIRHEPWMQPHTSRISLHYMHQDQVTELPANAVVIASSEHCPIAAFRVGETMLGIQAHPEFTSNYSRALLNDRTARIGADRVNEALSTLDVPTDQSLVSLWLASFLT